MERRQCHVKWIVACEETHSLRFPRVSCYIVSEKSGLKGEVQQSIPRTWSGICDTGLAHLKNCEDSEKRLEDLMKILRDTLLVSLRKKRHLLLKWKEGERKFSGRNRTANS